MTEVYSNKWSGGYGDTPSKAWTEGLQHLDPQQIRNGVDKCVKKGLAWPPSLPEFVKLCGYEASDIGAPDIEEAYKEACNLGKDILQTCQGGYKRTIGKEWTHAAIYQAYKSVDGWQFMEDKKKRAVFETKYDEMINRIISGEQLEKPERTLSIEDKNPSGVKTENNCTVARETLDSLKNLGFYNGTT